MTWPSTRSEARHADEGLPAWLRAEPGWRVGIVFAAVWLVFLLAPLTDAWARYPQPGMRVLSTLLMACFVALYVGTFRTPFGAPRGRSSWLIPLAMLVLALALLPIAGQSGLNLLIFVSVIGHATLPMWRAVAVTAFLVLLSVALLLVCHWDDDGAYPLSILGASMAMFGVVRMAERNRSLATAAKEQARLAVLEERERIGRDLHDILGHSLTVIAVKSELAGKLIERDPTRARAEIADVERLTRDALADVRATAAGVRDVTLVLELSAARTALVAAGIEPDLPNAVDEVPGELRQVFGYVVREGVTNVVRHSHASRCTVRVTADSVEVLDDGGPPSGPPSTTGQGLAGLRDRVSAAGLTLEAGPIPGGFRLAAWAAGAPQDQPQAEPAGLPQLAQPDAARQPPTHRSGPASVDRTPSAELNAARQSPRDRPQQGPATGSTEQHVPDRPDRVGRPVTR